MPLIRFPVITPIPLSLPPPADAKGVSSRGRCSVRLRCGDRLWWAAVPFWPRWVLPPALRCFALPQGKDFWGSRFFSLPAVENFRVASGPLVAGSPSCSGARYVAVVHAAWASAAGVQGANVPLRSRLRGSLILPRVRSGVMWHRHTFCGSASLGRTDL